MDFLKHFYLFRWLKDSSRGMRPSFHSINRSSVRHFGGLKMRFFKGRDTLNPQVSSIHRATCNVQLIVILAAWKSDSYRVGNPPFQANWLHVNHCSTFWLLENVIRQRFIILRFLKGRETFDPQVSSIHRASVRPFGGLTMKFFKGHETLGWRLHVFRWATFRHFGGLKKRFLPCR
jgi:hypothetical protein